MGFLCGRRQESRVAAMFLLLKYKHDARASEPAQEVQASSSLARASGLYFRPQRQAEGFFVVPLFAFAELDHAACENRHSSQVPKRERGFLKPCSTMQ